MSDRDPSIDLLRDALRASPSPEGGHLDDVALASYLDGVLTVSAQETVEAHLAACPECRELATEAALAAAQSQPAPAASSSGSFLAPDPSRWRRRSALLLAAAAVSIIGVGSVIFFQRFVALPDLGSLGVTAAELESAGAAVRGSAREALRAKFDLVAGLPQPEALASDTELRGEIDAATPLPIAPRWTAVRSERPELVWSAGAPAASWEVLVIDESEALAAAFEVEGTDGRTLATLPPEIRLEPGTVYLWKVNARRADGVSSSPWVPFRRLAAEEMRAAERQVTDAGGDPFLQASVLAAWGLDQAALDNLALVPADASGQPAIERLARALLERQRLPADAIESELTRRLGGG